MNNHPLIEREIIDTKGFHDVPLTLMTSGEPTIYFVNTETILRDNGEFAQHGDNAGAMYKYSIGLMGKNPVFKDIIYILADEAHRLLGKRNNVAISGGQRRDWLFSAPVAKALELPHISLYKQEDGKEDRIEVHVNGGRQEYISIKDFHVVHVADLLTTAESYYGANPDKDKACRTGWLPMLRNAGATIDDTIAVVSRCQGGEEKLEKLGVHAHSFVRIDEPFLRANSKYPEKTIDAFKKDKQWAKSYLAEHGALELLAYFDPAGAKLARAKKFYNLYRDHLDAVDKLADLELAVLQKYGMPLENVLSGKPWGPEPARWSDRPNKNL